MMLDRGLMFLRPGARGLREDVVGALRLTDADRAAAVRLVRGRAASPARAVAADVAALAGIAVEDIFRPGRQRNVAHARQLVMFILRRAGFSAADIGRALGGLDHSTVLHGVRAEAARRGEEAT